jgi:hypothetical protein
MKIYNSGSYGRGIVFVSPGAQHPENAAWVDPQTKKPILITVKFVSGVADVDSALGKYMIERGLAQKTPVYVPPEAVAENEELDRLKRENAALQQKLAASRLLLA